MKSYNDIYCEYRTKRSEIENADLSYAEKCNAINPLVRKFNKEAAKIAKCLKPYLFGRELGFLPETARERNIKVEI